MSARARLDAAMATLPLVAILRGITPAEIDPVSDCLVEAGFTMIEIPLNSPDPLASIARLAARHGDRILAGAGTVLRPQSVAAIGAAGGALIVSPDCNPAVIEATVAAGMIAMPGYFTPSEALRALAAGAHALKLFPADGCQPVLLKAQRAVLPPDLPVFAVGGITPDSIAGWRAAGASGFGIGSALYRPGKSVAAIASDAASFCAAARAGAGR